MTFGAARGIAPAHTVDPFWRSFWPETLNSRSPASLVRLHPLGLAALLLSDHDEVAAHGRLNRWLQRGIPADDRFLLEQRSETQPCPLPDPSSPGHLQVWGVPLDHWASHAWLQRLPYLLGPEELQQTLDRPAQPGEPIHVLHLPLNDSWWNPEHLSHLRRVHVVWDPSPQRIRLLRLIGVNAYCIDPEQPSNGWLRDPELSLLGIPRPDQLPCGELLILGSLGSGLDGGLPSRTIAIPAYKALAEPAVDLGEPPTNARQARALAAWLQHCQQRGLQLVRLHPTPLERSFDHYQALDKSPAVLSCQLFDGPISLQTITSEMQWRSQGFLPPAVDLETPTAAVSTLWEQRQDSRASVAVCISLHNYADRIQAALQSVFAQSHPDLELIVVDDASTDDGAECVKAWMSQHSGRFARTLLLQHQSNAGLASARNTAFAATRTEWCFVLDADNCLEPEAVSACFGLAQQMSPEVAVIHPLIRDCPDSLCGSATGLLSPLPWGQERLRRGNYIDAMALVRRSAWQVVGGYVHIHGGWEDYDFWCSLIDAGFQGVQCPQVLARYNRHHDSMLATSTQPQMRAIARQLQARHPWLELPMAAKDV